MVNVTDHFGLHVDGGDVFFLHEQKVSACINIKGLESPFKVHIETHWVKCPHSMLPLGAGTTLEDPDELVLRLAPIPDGGAYWVPPSARQWLDVAAQMCGASRRITFVPWAQSLKKLAPQLQITNLAPLIIAGYETKHFQDLQRLLAQPRVRTIVLCGAMKPPSATAVQFSPTVPSLDWGKVGVGLLRGYVAQKAKEARS